MKLGALVLIGLTACGTAAGRAPHPLGDGGAAASGGSEGGAALGEPAAGGSDAAGAAQGGLNQAGASDGAAGARACDPDAVVDPGAASRVHGLALHRLAVFQAVKVPIMELGQELAQRKASLVSGRPALLRAYVEPAASFLPRLVLARLTLTAPVLDAPHVLDQTRLIQAASSDAQLTSTFNFEIPAELMTEDVSYSVELLDADPCSTPIGDETAARFPEIGEVALGVLPGATLHVQVVPVEYQAGDVTLAPDTSPEQLERLRHRVRQLFPIVDVEVELRAEPLTATGTTMLGVLDQVVALQEQEQPPANVAYYGLVRLTETREQYCNPSCVLGASLNGQLPSVGVGVGIGYTGDEAASTIAHELGHVYGRPHTPCGVPGDVAYPYSGGRIGSWGYDVETQALFDPGTHTDFMGYCTPIWVSDHTFEQLRQFIEAVEPAVATARAAATAVTSSQVASYRSLLLEPGRAPVWGVRRRLRGVPAGQLVQAQVFDVSGRSAGRAASAFRRVVADTSAEIVYVPDWVERGWASLSLGQRRIALPTENSHR